jgi:hypothetical protein
MQRTFASGNRTTLPASVKTTIESKINVKVIESREVDEMAKIALDLI